MDRAITGTDDPPDYSSEGDFAVSLLSDSAQQAYYNLEGKISAGRFVELYNQLQVVQGEKDKNGRTVSGSLKQNRYDRLIEMGVSAKGARRLLTELYGYKWS